MPIGCSVEKSIRTKATTEPKNRLGHLTWFLLLWLTGVGLVSALAYLLRWIMSGVYGGF